jgi:hypothetical protein
MPSKRSRPEGTKYGKITYFGYSGRHQVHMNFQPSPPLPYMLKLLPRFLLLPTAKIMCNIKFIFVLIKLLANSL